jgi:hypothetical protein
MIMHARWSFVWSVLVAGFAPAAGVAQTLPEPEPFDRVLATYVHGGLVDYAALAKGRADLDLYLEQLGRTSPTDLDRASRDARLAFWINAYNACALRVVIDHYPIGRPETSPAASPMPANSIRHIPDVWTRQFCRVAQRDRSLDGIEHGVLRPLGDPRILFALSCAAQSCPPPGPEAYRAERVNDQLDAAVARFVADPRAFVLTPGDPPVLRVNRILDWDKEDFGGTSGVVAFLRRYVPGRDAELLRPRGVRVEYFEFDWTLNDIAAAPQQR